MSSSQVTTTEAEVTWAGDYLFLGNDPAGHTIVFDSSEKGVSRGMSPMKALLTCVGSCSGMDIVAILGKRKQKLTSLRILVTGERQAFGSPKPFTGISLKFIVTGKQLDRKHVEEAVTSSIEKYCSVAATLNEKAKISYSFEVHEAEP